MSRLSGVSTDTRNKAIAVAAFVLLAGGILYWELFAGGTPNPAAVQQQAEAQRETAASGAPPRAAASGKEARQVTTGSGALDPTLRMSAMLVSESVEYSGTGRNIFSPNSAPPVVIPKPVAPARPVANVVVPLPVRTGPPPPPPIDLKFFGVETDADGKRQAILLHQDTVYTAAAGDVVLRRYKILNLDAKSMQVEDMVTNNRQTLVLVAN